MSNVKYKKYLSNVDIDNLKSIKYRPNVLSFVWQFILQKKFTYLILLILSIVSACDEIVTPLLLDEVIKNLTLFNENNITASMIKLSIYKMVCIWLIFDTFYRISGLLSAHVFPLLEGKIRMFMFNEIQYYKPTFFSNDAKEGSIENSIADTADGVQEIVEFIIVTLIPTTLSVLLSIFFIFKRNLIIGSLIGGWAFVHILLSIILLKKAVNCSSNLQHAQNQVAGSIVDSLMNRNITLQCDQQNLENTYILTYQNKEITAHKNLLLYNEFIKFILNGFLIIISIFLFIHMTNAFIDKKLFINDVVFLFITVFSIVRQIWQIGTQLTPFVEGLGQCAKGLSILKSEDKLNNIKNNEHFNPRDGSIEFRNVTLYEDNKLILDNISFRIEDKEKIAFIGRSGSGKTTILKLILGLTSDYTGEVFIGGINLKTVNSVDVRKFCGMLDQKHYWFNRTIKENLLYGHGNSEEVTEENLIEACKKASVYEVIKDLKDGFNTKASANTLSGGQIQRLCLTRLLLRNNEILMCDELGNGLDILSLKYIGEFIENFKNTFIMTTHNLYYQKLFDKFLIINEGKLIDVGTHDELKNRCHIYQEMLKQF
jgi:ATP-binding cassette subfamily B protein